MSDFQPIRRLNENDLTRLLPRLVKFCARHEIATYSEDIDGGRVPGTVEDIQIFLAADHPRDALEWLELIISDWIEDGEVTGDMGKRAQMARRVWQRAVQEPNAEFGLSFGNIGYYPE